MHVLLERVGKNNAKERGGRKAATGHLTRDLASIPSAKSLACANRLALCFHLTALHGPEDKRDADAGRAIVGAQYEDAEWADLREVTDFDVGERGYQVRHADDSMGED